jgi:uncharacterized membrane protein
MNLRNYEVLILIITAIAALIVASPALQRLLVYPQTEYFTELWLLGPSHMAEDMPYNITKNVDYKIFLGVSNQLGECAYYEVQAKFRNQNQSGPDSFNHTESSLSPIAKYTFTVDNGKSFEFPVNVTFNYEIDQLLPQMNLNNITVNDATYDMGNLAVPWDSGKNAYLGNLFFELYLYNSTLGDFHYNQRYVSLWVNLS